MEGSWFKVSLKENSNMFSDIVWNRYSTKLVNTTEKGSIYFDEIKNI